MAPVSSGYNGCSFKSESISCEDEYGPRKFQDSLHNRYKNVTFILTANDDKQRPVKHEMAEIRDLLTIKKISILAVPTHRKDSWEKKIGTEKEILLKRATSRRKTLLMERWSNCVDLSALKNASISLLIGEL